jgi:hypothetical protein
MTEGCVWAGNPQNGACVSTNPDLCAEIAVMQLCNANPSCVWDNQAGTCGPA